MGASESGTDESERSETVSVSRKGQATIPKKFREEYGIDTPGRVRFEKNEAGELVVKPIQSIRDFRGAGSGGTSGSAVLGESRAKDRERDERLVSASEETDR